MISIKVEMTLTMLNVPAKCRKLTRRDTGPFVPAIKADVTEELVGEEDMAQATDAGEVETATPTRSSLQHLQDGGNVSPKIGFVINPPGMAWIVHVAVAICYCARASSGQSYSGCQLRRTTRAVVWRS